MTNPDPPVMDTLLKCWSEVQRKVESIRAQAEKAKNHGKGESNAPIFN